MEKLLKLNINPNIRAQLQNELKQYKEHSANIDTLNAVIERALSSVSDDDKNSLVYQQVVASKTSADDIDKKCREFSRANRHSHPTLKEFKDGIAGILNAKSNEVLNQSKGFSEIMAVIWNTVARYSGVGYVIAAAKGKFKDFHDYKWTLFSEKTKDLEQIESIASRMNTKPGG